MSSEGKHFVVHGAKVKCKFSEDPSSTDELQVKSQKKHFLNDKEGEEKLIATDKEIGSTLKKGTFGKCKMQPSNSGFLPCQAVITKWSEPYDKISLEENSGKPLLENSKATCPIGGPDCISIDNHGQKAKSGSGESKKKNKAATGTANPAVNTKEVEDEKEEESTSFVE